MNNYRLLSHLTTEELIDFREIAVRDECQEMVDHVDEELGFRE